MVCQSCGTAELADAHGSHRRERLDSPGKRQRDTDIGKRDEARGEFTRLARAAKDADVGLYIRPFNDVILPCAGADSLRARASRLAERETYVLGGKRHLELAQSLISGKAHAWSVPFDSGMQAVQRLRGEFGVGATLARHVDSLAPQRGELLWDIRAGSSSISIEWMLARPSLNAIAVEQYEGRLARILCNASASGVPRLRVIHGEAPGALAGIPTPDAIFIGGDACAQRLNEREPGLAETATVIGLSLMIADEAAMRDAASRCMTWSVASLAEATGSSSHPLCPWLAVDNITCAIAIGGDDA
ncbi:hypothetical protein [Mesorhizobium sp. 2RAF21]|uniref:hypothetical protein n=1 Tax=Mesorhizobium sp. 2RAF21 TaxID=3232995 RepID=UPI003F94BDD4